MHHQLHLVSSPATAARCFHSQNRCACTASDLNKEPDSSAERIGGCRFMSITCVSRHSHQGGAAALLPGRAVLPLSARGAVRNDATNMHTSRAPAWLSEVLPDVNVLCSR